MGWNGMGDFRPGPCRVVTDENFVGIDEFGQRNGCRGRACRLLWCGGWVTSRHDHRRRDRATRPPKIPTTSRSATNHRTAAAAAAAKTRIRYRLLPLNLDVSERLAGTLAHGDRLICQIHLKMGTCYEVFAESLTEFI